MIFFKRFITGNIFYAILNASFIYSVLTPYIRSAGIDPLRLSTIQAIESFFWFIFMYVSGIIFDRFGAKISFLLGRIIDFISMIFLLNPTFYNLVFAYICIGISKGSIYGKYESYMYNYLSINNKLSIYPRIASIYYFFWDISLSGMAFVSSILLKDHSYQYLIYLSIVLKVISIVSVIFLIPNEKQIGLDKFRTENIKEIFIKVFQCMKDSSNFTYLLIFYGVLNFFTYPLCLVIGDMVLVDMGFDGKNIARYTSLIVGLMAVGTLFPIFIWSKGIKVKTCLYLSSFQIFIMFISSLLYNKWLFIFSAIFICTSFALIEVSIEKHFERYSNKKIRGSAISLSISISTLIRMLAVMLIGAVAKCFSYHIGLICIVLPILLFLLLIFYKLKNIED